MNLKDSLTTNLWAHIGACIAVAIGLVDAWGFHSSLTQGSPVGDLIFIIGGLAAFGVNIAAPQNKA
jgi:hypothetical protein